MSENWPQWRGPLGRSFRQRRSLQRGGVNQNVAWRSELAVWGSSPIVWGISCSWLPIGCGDTQEGTPLSLDDARRLVEGYVEHYNNVRLNSAIGYITPKDMLAGRQQKIHAERDRKLEEARKQRQIRRQRAA